VGVCGTDFLGSFVQIQVSFADVFGSLGVYLNFDGGELIVARHAVEMQASFEDL